MALKKSNELCKAEKQMLLKSIANGEIDKGTLTPDTLFACEYEDYFLGLVPITGKEIPNLICLGEAKTARQRNITDIFMIDPSDDRKIISMCKKRLLTEDSA